MDVRNQISAIEEQLRQQRVSVAALLRSAEVNPTNWTRWKRGMPARPGSWARIEKALTALKTRQAGQTGSAEIASGQAKSDVLEDQAAA